MNILTHPIHTGYQFDLAKTGHDFYSVFLPCTNEKFWDSQSRPLTSNFHFLDGLQNTSIKMDLILVHNAAGYHFFKDIPLPIIFKEHCLREHFQVPIEWCKRISFFCFSNSTAACRWAVPAVYENKKIIIGMGMDIGIYGNYEGDVAEGLIVAHRIKFRGEEKGFSNFRQLSKKAKLTVVGRGNQQLLGDVGPAKDHADLFTYYKTRRVFVNCSNILGMATLEAMSVGMPVVAFRTLNSDIIKNDETGFLVDTVKEAAEKINMLLTQHNLAKEIGRQGQKLIIKQFSLLRFVEKWNALFLKTYQKDEAIAETDTIKPIRIDSISQLETDLIQELVKSKFSYERVGHDKREMSFLMDGLVGLGKAKFERYWRLKFDHDGIFLEISSNHLLICRLRRINEYIWSGKWLYFERMEIILSRIKHRKSLYAMSPTRDCKIFALIAFRNEENLLSGWFSHIRNYIDGFIAFDDHSTDKSYSIANNEPKMIELLQRQVASDDHYFEIQNRKAILESAYKHKAEWLLCADADERFETRFLEDLQKIINESKNSIIGLKWLALWENMEQYRISNARKFVLFPCVEPRPYYPNGLLHQQWFPPKLHCLKKTQLDYHLYHLGSLTHTDRVERYNKFMRIDPKLKHQRRGYKNIISDNDVVLSKISNENSFKMQ